MDLETLAQTRLALVAAFPRGKIFFYFFLKLNFTENAVELLMEHNRAMDLLKGMYQPNLFYLYILQEARVRTTKVRVFFTFLFLYEMCFTFFYFLGLFQSKTVVEIANEVVYIKFVSDTIVWSMKIFS